MNHPEATQQALSDVIHMILYNYRASCQAKNVWVGLEIPIDRFDPAAWQTLQQKIAQIRASGGATYNLQETPVPDADLPQQRQFAQIVQRFDRVRAQQREAMRQAEQLFNTLLHRAFRGEL